MRRTVALLLIVLELAAAQPAFAWEPIGGIELDEGVSDPPDPAPLVIPEGIYLVTDVYSGDVVTSSGNTTVYSTTTVRDQPGTYARVVEVVGTGEASRFDGRSFNRRARLPDGRLVAGTYYEDFVLTPVGHVSVNIVFFQDDSATYAVASTPVPTPTAQPIVSSAPLPSAPAATPAPTAAPTPRPVPSASAGVALGPTAPVLASIEVLRGRPVRLWLRAFVDGVPVAVSSWRFVSGSADSLSPTSGTGSDPCDVTWLTLAPPGSTWTLRFAVQTSVAPGRVLNASIRVAVRSPALLQ